MTCGLALVLLLAAPPRPAALGRPALEELAVRIADQVEGAKPEPPVGVWVEGVPPVLARAFASTLAAQLSARRKAPSVLEVTSASEAEAVARAHDLRTLVRVVVQLDGQKVVARGDAIHTWVNFWSGARASRPEGAAPLAASVEADAVALALGATLSTQPPAPVGPLKLSLTSLAKLSGVPAAIAFGDADGDGRPELAVLQDDGLAVLELDGRLKVRTDLREVPGAVSPTREPFGAVAISAGRVSVASGKKARPTWLQLKGERLEAAGGALVADGVAVKLAPGLNVFERQVTVAGRVLELPAPFTTASARGNVTLAVFPDGSAMLVDAAVPTTRFWGAGAGSALADLDGDGTPEVVVSSTRYAADGD
ncbi:MAG: VCBS repeat-containing protein, partial [Myxococcaceae bacterium]|nr:VCBS repeat-containing protein [Myxococcaceae bacterium]